MTTVTKRDLVERVCARTQLNRPVVRAIVESLLSQFREELVRGNRIEIRDFGVFETRSRRPRTAQNPKTLTPVTVPARRTVRFKVGRNMKKLLDSPPVSLLVETPGQRAAPRGARRSTRTTTRVTSRARPAPEAATVGR